MTAKDQFKIFNDPVHGHIEMPELCVKIINTPQFQRLRNIKQLGGCYFVYPGAAHNRFEHSIGTSYLAGCLVENLQRKQRDLEITEKDILCVKIAGLCHDLGHGPFSHLFDKSFIPRAKDPKRPKWTHEKASVKMLDYLIEKNNLKEEFSSKNLDDEDITFIKELINGTTEQDDQAAAQEEEEEDDDDDDDDWPYKGRPRKKGFLYEIINNKRNGIDVDKWDYFARDCHNLGMRNSFDHMRCIKMARVIDIEVGDKKEPQICFRDKEVHNIYEMFHTRSNLHKRAYQHKTSNAIEEMITEALVKANDFIKIKVNRGDKMLEFKMSKAIYNMEAYTKLTDNVYYEILYSTDPDLKPARDILEKIERRELYKFVEERSIKSDEGQALTDKEYKKISYAKIEENEAGVKEEDIFVDIVKFDYGMKDKNPVDSVYFYRKEDTSKAFTFTKEKVSYLLPEVFSEKKIRVYLTCKPQEREKIDLEVLTKGFDDWFKEPNSEQQESETNNQTPEKEASQVDSQKGTEVKKKLKYPVNT